MRDKNTNLLIIRIYQKFKYYPFSKLELCLTYICEIYIKWFAKIWFDFLHDRDVKTPTRCFMIPTNDISNAIVPSNVIYYPVDCAIETN